jgi:hypothetical protein
MRRTLSAIAAFFLLAAAPASDPIADAIARLKARARPDDMAGITRAEDALQKGYRMLALQRVAATLPVVEAITYAAAHAKDDLDAEWKRNAKIRSLAAPRNLQPAAVGALAEVAGVEARGYYDASLDYAKATSDAEGFFYLGRALGQKTFIDLARQVSQASKQPAPPLRSIAGDLDSLQRELLAAYKPPASIDRHGEFIGASAMIKEARELDAAGLRYGAMIRYLEAARRTALITTTPKAVEVPALPGDMDHSIAQIFVDSAKADPANASIIVSSVLPRYFAAIKPAAEVAHAAAKHTITLVRWPYT